MKNYSYYLNSQRLNYIKLFLEHRESHPLYLETAIDIETQAVCKPLGLDLQKNIAKTLNANILHTYNESYFKDLKDDIAYCLNIQNITANNIFIAKNLYAFYEYLTEMFLQKDQKVFLFTSDEYSFSQEAKYINAGKIILEYNSSPAKTIAGILPEIEKDDYKILVLCSENLKEHELEEIINSIPENTVLVLRTFNTLPYNYINHSSKTVFILRTFPSVMTMVEPPICFAISNKHCIKQLNTLQQENHLDTITLFNGRFLTKADNLVEYPIKKNNTLSESYEIILNSIIRESIEEVPQKDRYSDLYTIATQYAVATDELVNLSSLSHFRGISDKTKELFLSSIASQDTYSYTTQRAALINGIASNLSTFNDNFFYHNILLGADISDLLEIAVRAFINDGDGNRRVYKDKILILENSPLIYDRIARKKGCLVHKLRLNNHYDLNIDYLTEKVKDLKIKMLIIDSPSILFGNSLYKEQIEKLLAEIPSDTIIIVDETLAPYAQKTVSEFKSFKSYIKDYPNLIVLRSFSSINALAGMQVGFALAQEPLINAMDTVRHPFNVSLFSINMAMNILDEMEIFEDFTCQYIQEQKNNLYKFLTHLGLFYIDSSTNTVTFSTSLSSLELFEKLLHYKILVKPLSKNFVRVSISDQHSNAYFIKCLGLVLGNDLQPQQTHVLCFNDI